MELLQARFSHRLHMPVKEPSVRRAVVAGVHLILRVGAEGVELDGTPSLPAAARGVGEVQIIHRAGNGGGDQVLFQVTGSDRVRRVGPDAVCGKPIREVIRVYIWRIGGATENGKRAD